MKRCFILLIVAFIACGILYANGSPENIYVKDEFGDFTNDFYRGLSYYDGTYKLSTGKTGDARMQFMLNSFNKDVIISIQDHVGPGEYGTEWYDYDCLLSWDWNSTITVKIKYQSGTVKEYKGTLKTDDITGTGFKKMIQIKDMQDDIVGQKSMMIAISNSYVSYTFRDLSLHEENLLSIKINGDWKIMSSTEPTVKNGELHLWSNRGSTIIIDDIINTDPEWGTDTIDDQPLFFFSPGNSDEGPYYAVSFSSDEKEAVLTNISTKTEIILQRI
ncbi:MAG: hypothetical protein MSB08_01890 [Subdoligranulum sp.]|nr:hypothetical protein [Subdoligranulum sp.]